MGLSRRTLTTPTLEDRQAASHVRVRIQKTLLAQLSLLALRDSNPPPQPPPPPQTWHLTFSEPPASTPAGEQGKQPSGARPQAAGSPAQRPSWLPPVSAAQQPPGSLTASASSSQGSGWQLPIPAPQNLAAGSAPAPAAAASNSWQRASLHPSAQQAAATAPQHGSSSPSPLAERAGGYKSRRPGPMPTPTPSQVLRTAGYLLWLACQSATPALPCYMQRAWRRRQARCIWQSPCTLPCQGSPSSASCMQNAAPGRRRRRAWSPNRAPSRSSTGSPNSSLCTGQLTRRARQASPQPAELLRPRAASVHPWHSAHPPSLDGGRQLRSAIGCLPVRGKGVPARGPHRRPLQHRLRSSCRSWPCQASRLHARVRLTVGPAAAVACLLPHPRALSTGCSVHDLQTAQDAAQGGCSLTGMRRDCSAQRKLCCRAVETGWCVQMTAPCCGGRPSRIC